MDQNTDVSSEALTFTGDIAVEGEQFKQYEGNSFQAGDSLRLRLANLPAGQGVTQPAESGVVTTTTSTSTIGWRWLILAVGGVLLIAGIT